MGKLFLMVSMATEILLTVTFFPLSLLSRAVADLHCIRKHCWRVPDVGRGGPQGCGVGALGMMPGAGGASDASLQPCPLCARPAPVPRGRTASPTLAVQLPSALRASCSPKPQRPGQSGGSGVSTSTTCVAGGATRRGPRPRAAGGAADGMAAVCRGSQRARLPARPGRGCRPGGRCQHASGCPAPPTSRLAPGRGRAGAQVAGLRLHVAAQPARGACSPLAVGLRPAGTRTRGVSRPWSSFWGAGCLLASCKFPCCPACGSVGPRGQPASSGVAPPHRTWGSCLWDAAGDEGPSPGPAPHPVAQTLARSLWLQARPHGARRHRA